MLGRAFYLLIAGALGGALAWALTEPFAPSTFADVAWAKFQSRFGLTAGICIGVLLGGASGLNQGSKMHVLRGAGMGLILGAIGGTTGLFIGNKIYTTILGAGGAIPGANVVVVLLARMIGWSLFGGFIGLAEGAVGRNFRRAFHGMIGGLLGGALGGLAFEVSGMMAQPITMALKEGDETGTIPRAVALVATGAGIGLLVGIVEALSRSAWVRLALGRNEGKEWLVDAPQNFIGRSENAHIPLFGDQNIAPMHAAINRQGHTYFLVDGGSPMGTGLNGQRINQAQLSSGDVIQIGNFQLTFMLKAGKAIRARPEPPAPYQQPQMPPSQTMQQTIAVPASTHAPPTLTAISGPLAGQRFPVLGPIEVGREGGAIPLQFDQMVSRRHVRIEPIPGGVQVTDLGSTNGTSVNGQRITAQVAKNGDTVQIGATVFRVE